MQHGTTRVSVHHHMRQVPSAGCRRTSKVLEERLQLLRGEAFTVRRLEHVSVEEGQRLAFTDELASERERGSVPYDGHQFMGPA